jgi:midasin (ATPase involved in ribosome maturation)
LLVALAGSDQESDSDEEMDEKELDQQLGDLGDEECDKLDEQMWGSDNEDQPMEVILLSESCRTPRIIYKRNFILYL